MKQLTANELIQQAYIIVHAKAVDYEKRPDNSYWTTGIPSSIIRFQVEEIIKGTRNIPNPLLINGYLGQYDDFSDHRPPYDFVRRNGRRGSFFANTYKKDANFLLFLDNEYSPYWATLAPANEQLYSPAYADNWLQWVKNQVEPSTDQFITNDATKL